MMDNARSGKFDLILTKSISRFGRNTEETIQMLRELNECHIAVQFDEEKINSGEVGSEFVITILSAYAEATNQSNRKNQIWSMQKRLEDGTSELYTRECYGYRKNKSGSLEVNESEAEVVRMIYELYLAGASIHMIRKHLATEAVKTATGKDTWCKKAIEKILTNEKYIGDACIAKPQGRRKGDLATNGGYLVTDAHPAIIPRDVFAAVQKEKIRRSNVVKDESGTHRKKYRYSAARDAQHEC